MPKLSAKKIAIDKANTNIVIAVAISAFVVVFSLVAIRALYSQMRYQSKVSSQKEQTLETLNDNLQTADELTVTYTAFVEQTANVLGGNPQGNADRDGDNARIILDALPSKYDFPALTTSIEKLLEDHDFTITSFTGSDDEITQSEASELEDPEPIEMPFDVEINTSDNRGKNLLGLFERSIRPIQVNKLAIETQGGDLNVTITAKTYFQPEKSLNVNREVVK